LFFYYFFFFFFQKVNDISKGSRIDYVTQISCYVTFGITLDLSHLPPCSPWTAPARGARWKMPADGLVVYFWNRVRPLSDSVLLLLYTRAVENSSACKVGTRRNQKRKPDRTSCGSPSKTQSSAKKDSNLPVLRIFFLRCSSNSLCISFIR